MAPVEVSATEQTESKKKRTRRTIAELIAAGYEPTKRKKEKEPNTLTTAMVNAERVLEDAREALTGDPTEENTALWLALNAWHEKLLKRRAALAELAEKAEKARKDAEELRAQYLAAMKA